MSSNHLVFRNNRILNGTSGGIATVLCDYVTSDDNRIYHHGANRGWASGVSYNSSPWSDSYPGIHNYITNNIIAGIIDGKGDPDSGNITDGNGIILDLSNRTYDSSSPNTPPALIANNVAYMNGGRCIVTFLITNAWVVNNTCFNNVLDRRMGDQLSFSYVGEITSNQSKDSYFINNIAYASSADFGAAGGRQPYQYIHNPTSSSPSGNVHWIRNVFHGGAANYLPESVSSDSGQVVDLDPLFVDPTFGGEISDRMTFALPDDLTTYSAVPDPLRVTNQFSLRPESPLIGAGLDPTTLSGLDPALAADLRRVDSTDIGASSASISTLGSPSE